MKLERIRQRTGLVRWFGSDIDGTFAAIVCIILGAIALAGSATHVLHVGAYPHVGVSGWMVWTVAGSLEVLAAYAAYEMRQRRGWNRSIPAIVLLLAVSFIVLANLAAADDHSWAAQLPWAEAFAVAPPISFLSVAAIAETREWQPIARKRRAMRSDSPRTSSLGLGSSPRRSATAVRTGEAKQEDDVVADAATTGLSVKPDESRTESIARWVKEGHARTVIVKAGPKLLDVSESTVRRELRGADMEE